MHMTVTVVVYISTYPLDSLSFRTNIEQLIFYVYKLQSEIKDIKIICQWLSVPAKGMINFTTESIVIL